LELYKNGLNRQLFVPFLDLIEERMTVLELAAAKDFRLEKLAGRQLYFTPADSAAHAQIRVAFERLTGVANGTAQQLEVKGRKLHVPEAAMGVARFAFSDLCEKPLGALDYLHLAHTFHTVLIEGIPCLTPSRRNDARRLVNLIDTLYDNRVCLIASAEAEPHKLYPEGDGAALFERTASRLIEMRSEAYLLTRRHREPALSAAGTLAGVGRYTRQSRRHHQRARPTRNFCGISCRMPIRHQSPWSWHASRMVFSAHWRRRIVGAAFSCHWIVEPTSSEALACCS
jgi:hypothetical protein